MKTRKATTLLSLLIIQSLYTICSALPKLKAGLELNEYNQRQRQLSDCTIKLTSSTEEYREGTPAKGVFFTFSTSQDAELLSIEFAVSRNVSLSIDTEVYFRKDSFSGVSANPVEWTKVSSSPAQLSPNKATAIVPVLGFEMSALEANTEYSLYVSLNSNNTMLAKLSSAGIGEPSDDDGILQRYVGVLVDNGPFPSSLARSEIAEFMGVLHYKSVQTCTSILQTTKVDLEFGIDDIPSNEHLTELAASFGQAIGAIFVTNSTLSDAKREYMINVNSTAANFMGRSDVCKGLKEDDFTECALVTTSAQIEHLPSLTSGQLRRQILEQSMELSGLVISLSSLSTKIEYVGGNVTSINTALTFKGVPAQMEGTQIQYFQIVFAEFLQTFIDDMEIHEVVLVSQETSSRRNLRLFRRELETSVKSNFIVYGIGGTEAKLQDLVREAVVTNNAQLIRTLQLEVLRPGFLVLKPDVTVEPLFFTSLQMIITSIPSTGTPDTGGGSGGTDSSAPGATEGPLWQIILGAVGVAFATLFLIWRLYKDFCYKEKLAITKLKLSDSSEPSYTGSSGPPEEEKQVVVEQFNDENPGVEIVLAEEMSDIEEVYAVPPPPPAARGGGRSRSLDPTTIFTNRSGRKGSAPTQPRGRSVSPTPPTRERKVVAKDRLFPFARNLSPEANKKSLSTRSAHMPRSAESAGDRVLLSNSAHQSRSMVPEGAGKRWKEARGTLNSHVHSRRPKNQDRVLGAKDSNQPPGPRSQRSCNSAGEGSMSNISENTGLSFADDEIDSDLESESGLITDSPSKMNRWASETMPSVPVTPLPPTNSAPPASTRSFDAKANFKDDQMALYSPEEGTGLQLVQILQVQAFVGKKNTPCYKIRLQGSNVEKTMVKETYLTELGEDSGVGVPSMGSPSTRRKKTKSSPRTTKKSKSPMRKKSKSPMRNNSGGKTSPGKKKKKVFKSSNLDTVVHPEGGKASGKKKKKKARSGGVKKTRSLEDLERMKQATAIRKNSGQSKAISKGGEQEITRGVRRTSSWGGKMQGSPANQPLFKLPRRKNKPSATDSMDEDLESVESSLNSVSRNE